MDGEVLEKVYKENLEERIIAYLAETKNISLEAAMNIYYYSKIADKSQRGVEGIQYLDYKVLVQILCDTEKELLWYFTILITTPFARQFGYIYNDLHRLGVENKNEKMPEKPKYQGLKAYEGI